MISTGIGKRLPDEQVIVRQGDPADCLYVLLEGEVELVQEEEEGELPLAVLGSGAMFGELAFLDDKVHQVTVRARGEVRILTIDKRVLLQRFKEDPTFAIRILRRMAERIRDLTAELGALQRGRPSDR